MGYTDKEKQRAAARQHYLDNKALYMQRANDRKKALVKKVQALKEASPCVDCGVSYPYYVMQYDHTGDDKVMNVTRLVRSASWERTLAEIAKCELVCGNCHAARSHKRQQALCI